MDNSCCRKKLWTYYDLVQFGIKSELFIFNILLRNPRKGRMVKVFSQWEFLTSLIIIFHRLKDSVLQSSNLNTGLILLTRHPFLKLTLIISVILTGSAFLKTFELKIEAEKYDTNCNLCYWSFSTPNIH